MLPTSAKAKGSGGGAAALRSLAFLPPYLRRVVKWRQMDIELTCWQMLHLCIAPKLVYRHTTYHKQTKNQWARDDPAFVVLTSLLVAAASLAYAVTYGSSAARAALTVTSAVLVDFLGLGAALATACWLLANRYLRVPGPSHAHAVEQSVEWLYAFDVHCNSYFPLFVALYVLQFFLSPLLLAPGAVPAALSVALYAAALSYYHYTQFLGYAALPFLQHTQLFLYPIAAIGLATPLALLAGFNPTRFVLGIYFS